MGLAFFYSGKIKSKELIPAMTQEVKDICADLQWKYHIFNDHKFRGICFTPPGSETVFLTCNKDGRLEFPFLPAEREEDFTLFAKTQYAGYAIHKAVMMLLKHLLPKYFEKFEVNDESYYWETGDERLLIKRFAEYDRLIGMVTSGLAEIKTDIREPQKIANLVEVYFMKMEEGNGKLGIRSQKSQKSHISQRSQGNFL